MNAPSLAIVMPAWNAESFLPKTLPAALAAQRAGGASGTADAAEVLVVDPGSTDGTAALAEKLGARVLRLDHRAGPAEARNAGVAAVAAEIVLFLDADCVVHEDVARRVSLAFAGERALVALTGSYDDDPPERNFASQYMNLRHHFFHQHARREKASFWAGCGAVRREAFLAAGGFDAQRYPRPMIEDVELGTRMAKLGKMRLDPSLEATHLKRWTLRSVVLTDIVSRAVPWSQLILESGSMPDDLNLRTAQRFAALVAPFALLALPLLAFAVAHGHLNLAGVAATPILLSIAASYPLLRFFLRRRGPGFAVLAWGFHQVHLTYSATTYAICAWRHRRGERGRTLRVTRVVILGGGPAGVGGAWKLAQSKKAEVVLLERGAAFGGNAGSFEIHGERVDYGSHRLHPACDPAILADIRSFLGDALLDRPRHGRIRLLGRWVHFPLKPLDLLAHLDRRFALRSARDALAKPFRQRSRADDEESFASVLEASLGPTICAHFYFPYARKIWGLEPDELSAIQARRRVSAGSFGKLAKKVLSSVPGLKPPGAGRFFYPREGYGAISEAYADAALQEGAELLLGATATGVERPEGTGRGWRVHADTAIGAQIFDADHVWSTIPIPALARIVRPGPPIEVLRAAEEIRYRAMLLVYVELGVDRFSEWDAHYFPGPDVMVTRISEPKNYAVRSEPRDRTILCAEIPCEPGDERWLGTDEELGALVAHDLATSGIPLPARPLSITTRRLPQAYPIYRRGYEDAFGALDRWVETQENLLTYGRQGLFAHDNTHHALAMAYAASECLAGARFDLARWHAHREVFATHVVVD